MKQAGSTDYCTRVVTDLDEIGASRWNALAGCSNPFLRFEFLHALHTTGCATARTGWLPHYIALYERDGNRLAAAVPLYRKEHSYGEYVFDWAWADAHHQHGLGYYPKWLSAVPFTPVPGPRLLAIDSGARAELIRQLLRLASESGLSSLHVLFLPESEAELLAARGLLTRRTVQFHWFNRGLKSFDDYLQSLVQTKRKKVRAERRKVAAAGVTLERKVGAEITEADWAFFARCYALTYAAHHSTPYLSPRFFRQVGASMPESLLLVIARDAGRPIASALALFDRNRLYGRYWGAVTQVPCLHFEASYYQMIEFAIERGIGVFEGGAQGEHKLARGFEPVTTYSSHWLAHPGFTAAVERYLERESGGIESYVDELNERSALRARSA
jgi:predicted N-acyltransferase